MTMYLEFSCLVFVLNSQCYIFDYQTGTSCRKGGRRTGIFIERITVLCIFVQPFPWHQDQLRFFTLYVRRCSNNFLYRLDCFCHRINFNIHLQQHNHYIRETDLRFCPDILNSSYNMHVILPELH